MRTMNCFRTSKLLLLRDEIQFVLTFASFDYNPEIDNTPSFEGVGAIKGQWDRYLRQCFQNGGTELVEDDGADSVPLGAKAKNPRVKRGDTAVLRVTQSDGTIWIPDLKGREREELQGMVRGFLTAHYSMSLGTRHQHFSHWYLI
jgi:hypothetical protein